MKTRSKAMLLAAVLVLAPGAARAAVSTTLYVQGPGEAVLAESAIEVPNACTVVDSGGTSHGFTGHKAICALQTAKDSGVITDFAVTDWGFGFSLDSVHGVANAPDWSELWQLWVNGGSASSGIQGITLADGDAFQLTYGPWPTSILQGPDPGEAVGGPIVKDVYPRQLDVDSAISFLLLNQHDDGSFGHSLFTDWAGVALGAYEGKSAEAVYAKQDLKAWYLANPVPAGSPLTDYERRAMALMALGIDPYEGTPQNVIEPIVQGFDAVQFGSAEQVNDDIFAVLVLHSAGYEANVTPLLETLPFIISWQRESGSFGSIDLTAAAVQALSVFEQDEELKAVLQSAKDYLASSQETTGGFGNVYSTSWVLQAISALNEDGDTWAMEVDKRTPEHFLALHQAPDGGLLNGEAPESRIWATSYAIPAALSKGWGDALAAFDRPGEKVQLAGAQELQDTSVLERQVAYLSEEIEKAEARVVQARRLEAIESELGRIAKEVASLKPQIAALRASQLAQVPLLREDEGAAPGEESSLIVTLEDDGAGAERAEIKEGDGGEQFAAQASGTFGNFFSSSSGQAALVFGAGIVLFLVLGGWRVVLSLVRRPHQTRPI